MSTATTTDNWIAALEETAADLLTRARLTGPPVDAIDLAEKLKLLVVFDAKLQGRARHKKTAGHSLILLRPDDRPERLQWAAAHEIGEVFAYRIFEQVGIDGDDALPSFREQVANRMASLLLIPTLWFFDDVDVFDADLIELKKRYRTASHELLAMRLLDLSEPSVVSIFDQGELTRRVANRPGPVPSLQPLEQICWRASHQANRTVERREFGLRVRSWPVHERGWKREILRTTSAEEYDSADDFEP